MGLATWYDVAYYALLGLNAKKQHSLLHPSTWSAMRFTAAEQEAPICKWSGGSQESNHFRGPAEMVMSSMVIQAMQCHPLCNQWSGSDPTCTSFQTLYRCGSRMTVDIVCTTYYFDLLWGSNVLRCLTWVVAISCQFPDCWSSKEIASWMLTPITTTSDTQAGKTCLTVTQIRLWMIISKGKLFYWSTGHLISSYDFLWLKIFEKNIHRHPKQPSPLYTFPASSAVVTGRCGHPSLRTGFQKLRYAMGAWHLNVNVAASEILWPQIWNQRKIVHT